MPLILTDAQRLALPDWLRHFPCSDEHGNYQLTFKEWEEEVRWRLGLAKEPEKRSGLVPSLNETLVEEILQHLQDYRDTLSPSRQRDRLDALGVVLSTKLTRLRETNAARRAGMAKARAARKTPAGRPPLQLLVSDANGNEYHVEGYIEAAALIGCSPASLPVRMSNAIKKTGRALFTVGRANRADQMWSVEKLGTLPAEEQEPCQKDENEADAN